MRNLLSVAVFSLLLLSPVVQAEEPTTSHHAATEHGAAVTHTQGVLKAWNPHKVSIAHPAIESLGWPPMTMNFLQPQPPLAELPADTPIEFSFRQVDGGYQLITLSASQQ
ncbi:copper-binding protein [Serratia rhizosphaerae]|uniref:copper-binding protein n=1 Tax=unclassified Serratia (in: enterobacteria) TaxID=2647522 RepID=UPI000DA34E45|nr:MULTISPECIES: copper-binding protein [unclassified Serratia (in: enterobacteria)]MBU3892001.1 copper-binding protein [Serratia rubidaea]MCA4822597.1 copper-binding protein [Serratia rubidaea]QNK33855.1 copper-binding protein [Serratia sp. JUb9]CAE1148356.1 Cation efflux system protein CusF [Serratia sp. Tan611]SQJ14340.1 Cation efflux system protein CusF precursor [Serratia rubidaea]